MSSYSIFLSLTHFTYHDALQVNSCCCKWQDFLSYGCVVFLCVCIRHSGSYLQFSHSAMPSSLKLHGLQHARLPCPSPTPGACSNLCPLSRWYHPTISSPAVPLSSCPQYFPASGSFPMSQFFSKVVKILEFQLQHQSLQWVFGTAFRIDWLYLISVQGALKNLLQHHSSKSSILWCSAFSMVQLSHPYITIGKTIALTGQTFVDKVMSLLFNTL